MKRILIVTDSLGLPRGFPEKCSFDNTWPARLKANSDLIVYQISIGGATIDELYNQVNSYHLFFNPDIIIVQSGIVDCVPRALGKKEVFYLNSTLITRKISSFITKRFTQFLRKYRRIAYTNQKQFAFFLNNFNKLDINDSKIFWLGILPGSESYEKKVPRVTKRIDMYNQLIEKIFNSRFISLENIPRNGIMSDHHHLNELGHKYIYDQIVQKLKL